MLEVIDKGSSTESHPVPLLFVHGTWHAAWCWDEHFLDFFADKGYRAVALSLRGHGVNRPGESGVSGTSRARFSTAIAFSSDRRHAVRCGSCDSGTLHFCTAAPHEEDG